MAEHNNTLITSIRDVTHPLTDEIRDAITDGQWFRAGGDCDCKVCGQLYSRHKNIAGETWLTILCDGTLVKL